LELLVEDIEFRNILSFGNNITTIDFRKGLNLITGNNGAGKSSALLDTLSFCWYGQPYRNIKIDELLNRHNKKDLLVKCRFVISGNRYELTRGLKPKVLSITKNGKPLQVLSTKKLNQDEIDKIIGINYKIFKQIISLSINHNEPFLKLGLPKKRETIEQIFSIDVFAEMAKLIKIEVKGIKNEISIVNNSLSYLKSGIESDEKRISRLEKTKLEFDDNKKLEINEIDVQVKGIKKKFNDAKSKGTALSKEIGKKVKDTRSVLREKKDGLSTDKAQSQIEIRNADKIISSLNKHAVCPTCNSKITEDYKQSEIASLSNQKMNHENRLETVDKEISTLNVEMSHIEKELNDYSDKTQKLSMYKNRLIDLKSNIDTLNNTKKNIKNRKFEIDIDAEKAELDVKKLDYDTEDTKRIDLGDGLQIKNDALNALSDTGIKSFVFEEMIPILNYNINKYLQLFELPISLKFDKFMNETIKARNYVSDKVSYYCFSEGEKKKIDMSILLSFIAIKKAISSWNCNLLVIDELLDSSIDEDGLEKLLESMENMIDDDNNLGIYIISHRFKKEFFRQFTSLLEITKKREFSYIKHLKKQQE
tara:strand:+ start:3897 stop:5669 length:1773 start_codon:yes stop_codon:yes gene_type:complete